MSNQTSQKDDVEAGTSLLYPLMQESPKLRWAFIRKVYSIIIVQLLVTIAVASVVVTVHPIAAFFSTTRIGLAIYIVIILIPLIVLCPLYFYQQKHPVNFFLLGIFTVAFGFALGVVCAYYSGKVILETIILTAVLVISLTIYTFWAAKRGEDFKFLPAFIFGCLIVLLLFILIQIFFPLGSLSVTIYGVLISIVFCAYIIYDTNNLIKRFSFDEYIWASISLYLDVLNLFLYLLDVIKARN
ncbi:BI1 [Olea europaea subsp. europaea]|uniref:BI1 n=1 Tax=Olea europaea subsp. europaea TaxID=158383 RepID=A0A8S0VIL3_OLEEU|nr:BI1 [Olea europaea subsp. europaea]